MKGIPSLAGRVAIEMSELRWHPFLRQWVITATHRQDRTFLPPADFCPLCPTRPGAYPTEIPEPTFDVAVFQNRFPSLQHPAPEPAVRGNKLHPVARAEGICEVVVYTPVHEGTLASQPVRQIEKLCYVWKDRYEELGAKSFIQYVFIFENKGRAIGVTLDHPHGQIYAFPYLPPFIEREIESEVTHLEETGKCLMCDVLADEYGDKAEGQPKRLLCENESFAAFLPFFARWPYETYVTTKQHRTCLSEFTPEELHDLATLLKRLLVGFDRLFDFSFPYIMVMHQAPTDGRVHPHSHWHLEFYPPHRSAKKLKYLAGCESGAGSFINDTLAEEKAAELRAVIPSEAEL